MPHDSTADMLQPDVFELCLKSKNFHWHINKQNFRDWHFTLGEQAGQAFAMPDVPGEIARYQRVKDKHEAHVWPQTILAELRNNNGAMAQAMCKARTKCDEANDGAAACLLETFIDEMAWRDWFLIEPTRDHASDK